MTTHQPEQTNMNANNQHEYFYRIIEAEGGVYHVAKSYTSRNIGTCDVGYMKIAAPDSDTALDVAREAME